MLTTENERFKGQLLAPELELRCNNTTILRKTVGEEKKAEFRGMSKEIKSIKKHYRVEVYKVKKKTSKVG
eukprot:snap_masked-scaffold_21-processed-gene-5.36-mRNA-1 protein AED:1.00 eAED:1.00 QI:0/-1/0/0/-1/1/1/0/69